MTDGLTIEKCSISKLEGSENFEAMLVEYADELAMPGLPHPKAKMETYRNLEKIGILYPIGAFVGEKVVGILTVLMADNQHYGVGIAVSESFFVCKDYRKTGAGLKLLKAAESCAKELGSPGIFVSAKTYSDLCLVLPRGGYRESNRTFFKCLN